MKQSVLVLCTKNACNSQMAEGFLRSFDSELEVFSAGTRPAGAIHSVAIKVMREEWIDIGRHRLKPVEDFLDRSFDWVVRVFDGPTDPVPVFAGKAGAYREIDIADPSAVQGNRDEVLAAFRRVRDEIREAFRSFYNTDIAGK